MEKIRLLYVPNELGSFRHLGFRRPLANLLAANLIDDASVFSLQLRISHGGDPEEHRLQLLKRVREFRPNVVLMQHLGSTHLDERHFRAMRASCSFDLIYHEADPYSRWIHPLPRSAAIAGRFSNVTLTVGSGEFMKSFYRAGARDVRWVPSAYEPERYGLDDANLQEERHYDVVIVANRSIPRFRGHPNWLERIRFVQEMQRRFGSRLAIYGGGWSGVGAMGRIENTLQHKAIRSAWISANWDHYAREPKYFSNRLSISLATGSVHATTEHPQYDELFGPDTRSFLLTEAKRKNLIDRIESYIDETTPAQRIRASVRAQTFARAHLRQDDQLVSYLNYRELRIEPQAAKESWDLTAPALSEI